MRSRSLLALVPALLIAALPARAQLRADWISASAGGSGSDAFDLVRVGPDGSVYAAGSDVQPRVMRLTAGGSVLWQAPIPNLNSTGDVLTGLAVAADGAAFVSLTTVAGGQTDLAVRRVNADGTLGWSVALDGPNSGSSFAEHDTSYDIAVTPDGDAVALASTGLGGTSDPRTWLVRIDGATGVVEWQAEYNYTDALNNNWDMPQRVGVDCTGHIYAGGYGYSRGQGYLAEFTADGALVRAARTAFAGPTGTPATVYLDEMHVACDGTVTTSGTAEVEGNGLGRLFVAQFASGGAADPTWVRLPFGVRSYTSGQFITELAVDAAGRATVQVSLYVTPDGPHDTGIAQVNPDGTVRWTRRTPGSHYALAADEATVYTSNAFFDSASQTFRYVHQAFAAEDGAPLGRVDFEPTGDQVLGRAAAVDAAGGYVVAEGWRVRRLTPAPVGVAEVQVVHAAAAMAGFGPIEVYVNQPATSTTPDAVVSFRSGSAFLSLPSGQPVEVRGRLQNAPPPGVPREVALSAPALVEGRYVVSLVGIPAELLALFAPNPMGIDRTLDAVLAPFSFFRSGGVAVVVTNAVTDAPAVDVVVAGTGQTLADDLPYGQAAPAALLPAGAHRVEVRRSSDGALIEAVRFALDGSEGAFALAVTGFLDPSANQNGPAFRLTATDSTGTTDPGVVVTGSEDAPVAGLSVAVANPVRGAVSVRYALPTAGPIRLALVDALGRVVAELAEGDVTAGTHEARLDAGALAPGVYVLRLDGASGRVAQRVTVVR